MDGPPRCPVHAMMMCRPCPRTPVGDLSGLSTSSGMTFCLLRGSTSPRSRCHPGLHARDPLRREDGVRDARTSCAKPHSSQCADEWVPGTSPGMTFVGVGRFGTNTFRPAVPGPEVLRHFLPCPCYEAGAGRQGPYHCTFGDAAPAVPHASNGLPAASPRSSKPGGEPAYADRWQQTRHGFADVSCPFEAPGPRTSPSSWMRPAPRVGMPTNISARHNAGITFCWSASDID